ncbi:MAG: NUDIX domain-containing protein [Nanoarchaeota archaeon]|nr:NUDIX domain-containing protein [Nanoarchaeota archaeon]MEC8339516.1 NUDIX domain-containing protein [Nanoarchaeota archaeon]
MESLSSIDIIIVDKNQNILLKKRDKEPFQNLFSLVGGGQLQFESFDAAIERILKQKAGFSCKINNLNITHSSKQKFTLKQIRTYDSGDDSKGGNTTIFLLETNLDSIETLKLFSNSELRFFNKNSVPKLAFNHNTFISDFFFHEKNYTTKFEQDISITIDIVILTIQNESLKVLLSKRTKAPYLNHYSLPGGFASRENSLEEDALNLLKRDVNIGNIFLEQLFTFGDVERDERGRVISIAYYALIDIQNQNLISSEKYSESTWMTIQEIQKENIAFDHKKIISLAIERIKNKIEYSNIAFQLLPEKFTLAELQKVYEIILEKKLDKRNFRKKIHELEMLEELEEFKKEGRMRPAKYHRFIERTKETPLKAKRWI